MRGGPVVMFRWRSLWWEEGPDGVLGINWPRRLDIWVRIWVSANGYQALEID